MNLLVSNVDRICNDNEYIHVYVTEDQVTIRILQEWIAFNISTPVKLKTFEELFTHQTCIDNRLEQYFDYDYDDNVSFDDINLEDIIVPDTLYVLQEDRSKEYFIVYERSVTKQDLGQWDIHNELCIAKHRLPFAKDLITFNRYIRSTLNVKPIYQREMFDLNYDNEMLLATILSFNVINCNHDLLSCPKHFRLGRRYFTNIKFDKELDFENQANYSDVDLWYDVIKFSDNLNSTVQKDQKVLIEVIVNHDNSYTYQIDCDGGYIPHKEMVVEDGRGCFTLYTTDLDLGSVVTYTISNKFGIPLFERSLTVI